MTYEHHRDAEPDVNMPEILAGWYCECGYEDADLLDDADGRAL
jgi:hypothetical protein